MPFGVPMRYGGARAVQRAAPWVSPEEEQSLLSDIASKTFSTAGWIGGTLDKPGRTVRQVLASLLNPKHETDWSEMLAWVPFSDTIGFTKPQDQATGKDILGWNDPRSIWDDVVGFGVEVLTDPLNLVTFGASAMSKGGKALGKMGVLDEALEAAAMAKGIKPGIKGGMMPRQTRLTTSVDEALDLLKDRARQKQPGRVGDEAANLIETQFDDAVRSLGGDPFGAARSQPLGGLVGIQSPFNPFGQSIGYLGTGEKAQKIAAAVDAAVDTLKHTPGINEIRWLFGKKLGGATTRLGQWAARHGFKTMEEATEAGLTRVANAKRAMNASGMFDTVKVGEFTVINNHIKAREYIELSSRSRMTAEGVPLARSSQVERRFGEIKKQFDDVGLTPHLDDLAEAMATTREQALALGIHIPDLRDLEVGYWPRSLFSLRELEGVKEPMKLLQTGTEAQIWRQSWMKNLPEGTAGVMRLSMDKNLTVNIGGVHMPISGLKDRLAQSGMKMSDVGIPKNEIREAIEAAVGRGQLEDIIPTRSVGGRPLGKEALDEQMTSIINFITGLDVRHADMGIPAFHLDVTDDFVRWMQSTHRAIGAGDATHRMFAGVADMLDDYKEIGESVSVREALEAAGLWTKDVPLEDQKGALAFLRHLMGKESGGLEKLAGKIDIPANVMNPKYGTDWDDLRQLISGEVMNPKGEIIGRTAKHLRIPKEFVREATRVLDAYVNPEKSLNLILKSLRLWQNAWRAGVTVLFPGFSSRNFLGGQLNNFFIDAYDPRYGRLDPRRWTAQLKDTTDVLLGNEVKDSAAIYGGRMTDTEATNELMNEFFAFNIHDPKAGYKVFDPATDIRNTTELMSVGESRTGLAEGVGEYFLGEAGVLRNADLGTVGGTAADVAGTVAGIGPAYGALFGRGGFGLPGGGRTVLKEGTKDASKFYAMGHKLTSTVEAYNRISPYIALRRQGFAPAEAARRVFRAQVDYTNLSQFERRWMRGLVPFYSFTRGMVPFVIEDVLMRPGGKQAHAIKGIARVQREDARSAFAPKWIRQGTSIPSSGGIFGTPEPGMQRYVRAVGAPFEDVLSLMSLTGQGFGESARRTGAGLLKRVSPIGRVPLETGFGRSLYFDRDIRDLNPKYFFGTGDKWPISGGRADRLLDLIPGASRAAALKKKFVNPDIYGSAGKVLYEEALPWSFSDVNLEEQKARAIQNLLDPTLHGKYGVRQLPKILYMPEDDLRALRYNDPDAYRRMVVYLMNKQRARDMYDRRVR
jgi:hypothetical protein